MTKKHSLTLLLSLVLMLSLLVTGCSSKESVFKDMKEASKITASRSTTTMNLTGTVPATEDQEAYDTNISFTITKTTDGKNTAMDLSFDYDGWAMEIADFVRVVDDTIYVRVGSYYEYLFSMFGLSYDDPEWVSIPLKEGCAESSNKLIQSLSSELIDSLEKACKGQTIEKSESGTWTASLSGSDLQAVMSAFLEQVDKNISSWYDKYQESVTTGLSSDFVNKLNAALTEAMNSSNAAWNDYYEEQETTAASSDSVTETTASVTLDSTIDVTSDAYKKAQKESFLNKWTAFYEAYKASDASSDSEGSLSFSLLGDNGSRTVDSSFEMNANGESPMTTSYTSHVEEGAGSDFQVSAPADNELLDLDLVVADLVSIFANTTEDDIYSDEDPTENPSLVESGSGEFALNEDQASEIQEGLAENQVYIYDSDYEALAPRIITYDASVLTAVDTIADYTVEFDINSLEASYILFVYDMASLEEMTGFYAEQMDSDAMKTSSITTDCGEVTVLTDNIYDADDYATYIFALPVESEATLSGFLYVAKEEEDSIDIDTCIQALFKAVE